MKKATLCMGDRELEVVVISPQMLRLFSSPVAYRLMRAFEKPSYVSRVAAETGSSKQLVGMHVKRLARAGLLKETGTVDFRGGHAKLYRSSAPAIATIFSRKAGRSRTKHVAMPEKLSKFLHPLVEKGSLNGLVVVGSPHPHGPFRAVATDGHYGFQLGLFLGRYVDEITDFAVRLDVDVKSEKLYTENLMLLGGPGTNIITSLVNKDLPINFMECNYWAGIVATKQTYTSEFAGIVAKTVNPFDSGKTVIVLGGLRAAGTKACVIALTRFWEKLLSNYDGQKTWAAVVEGLDLDGDGKIDSVEILEVS